MHRNLGWVVAGLLLAVAGMSGAQSPDRRPNIIIIMADDMGFSDIGCYGGEISTPNLDRMAAGGLRFTQFYNTARCCPTRASLLTGLYAHQAGMGGMVNKKKGAVGTFSPFQGFLNDSCVTIAEVLGPAGYHTLMSGKWHVAEKRPNWPTDRGFDRYFGLISGACSYWKLDKGRTMALEDQPYFPPTDGSFYLTDAITDHAVKLIDEYGRKNAPFFHYVAYTAPHWPLHAWPEDIAKYEGRYLKGWEQLRRDRHARMIELGLVHQRWPLSPLDAVPWNSLSKEEQVAFDLKMAVYAAMIDRMDQGIGKILAKLREVGAEENTLVMFLADNGGCAENPARSEVPGTPPGPKESFLAYGKNWANASNTPFRRYKKWVHEGGIATPLIAHWPAVIKPGTLTDQVGHVIDLMATSIDLAGVSYPAAYRGKEIRPLDGKSLLRVFQGKRRKGHQVMYWEHLGNRAIRQGDWKLVSVRGGTWELYNLKKDRTELNDLADTMPKKVRKLFAKYHTWAKKIGARGSDRKPRRKS